ncbi:uncharacterized protein LOC123885948 [Trifolium pratense]|uniref:uncharacterized protein LOC123885948 n=1 Tax=Trifolium pratense TaxID=57577 RepID=UPI001E690AA8|nr:uncharacterized protein LOC123885948 [Trifolium pratense]
MCIGTKQKRLKNTKNSDNQEVTSVLDDNMLELIAKRLNVVSFCAFGAVCKRKNEICKRIKEDFQQSIAPLAMFTTKDDMMKTCYLFDMSNGKTMKVTLNNMDGNLLVGCTEGYIVFEKKGGKSVFLVNPLTGHQLPYSISSWIKRYSRPRHDHIIMATDLPSKSNVLLAVSNDVDGWCEYQIYHSGIDGWITDIPDTKDWMDVVVFKNRFYVVTNEAQLGELRIEQLYLKFNWLVVKNTPLNVDSENLKLVVGNNQLFMVDFLADEYLDIYKIDFDAMEWIKVDDLGDQALFLGGELGSAMRKPGKWGCPSNCVYFIKDSPPRCCLYSMEAKMIDDYPIEGNPTSSHELCSLGWYYPDQCLKINYVESGIE